MWVAAGLAAGALFGARVAHAGGRAEEDRPGNRPDDMQLPAHAPASAKPAAVPKVAVRRAAPAGYAAEAARSSSRLAPEERATRAFLRSAAIAARIEADASRLAASRSIDPAVRGYAEDLSRYRAEADLELLRLLHDRGMAPPMLETPQRKALNRLAKLDGSKFDRAYMDLVSVRQQQAELQQYQRAAQAGADPAVQAWAEKQIPALREQQAAARQLGGKPATAQSNPLRLSRVIAARSTGSNTR